MSQTIRFKLASSSTMPSPLSQPSKSDEETYFSVESANNIDDLTIQRQSNFQERVIRNQLKKFALTERQELLPVVRSDLTLFSRKT